MARGPNRVPAPMPPAPAFEVFCLKIEGQLELQMTVNTLYYVSSKPPGTAKVTEQIDLVGGFLDPAGPFQKYIAAVSIDWLGVMLNVWCPTNPGLATYERTLQPMKGTVPLPRLPTTVGVTMNKTTNFRGKHGMGRITVPGVPSAWVTGSQLTTTAAHTTLGAYLAANVAGQEDVYTPGVFAKKWDPVAKVYTLGWTNLRDFTTSIILGTCRRRKLGRGK